MGQFHHAAMAAKAGIDHLDRLSGGDSPVHRLHPAAKAFSAFCYIVFVISFPSGNISALVPFVLYPAIMMPLSGTPPRPLLSRLAVALPFALAAGVSNVIMMRGAAFTLQGFTVTDGMVSFVSILIKTAFSVLSVLILIATTSFADLGRLLTASKPVRPLGLQLLMTYRYISTLLDEADNMWIAYMLRAGGEKGVKMRDMGSFLGQLLIRSFDRSTRIYNAMRCRGFAGVYYSGTKKIFCRTDILFMTLTAAVCFTLRFFNASAAIGGFRLP
jgi:cobalt/nickel transport system permease protein